MCSYLSINLYEHGELIKWCALVPAYRDSVNVLVEIRDFFMKKILTKMRLRLISYAVIAVMLVVQPISLLSAAGVNTAGVDYLKTQTPSAWTTMALVSAGETGLSGEHLKAIPGSQAINYTAPIMAISALGEDPRTYPESDFVMDLKSFFDGTQIGDAATLNDDVFGILALVASGEPVSITEIVATKNYLISQQNDDGGWGFVAGGNSDTNTTAGAIMALIASGDSATTSYIQDALDYLRSAQNDDGGFPYDPKSPWGTDSDASSDAWVISALYASGIDPVSWNKGENTPISHLESLQAPEGYFQYQAGSGEDAFSPVTTSYAVIALNGDYYPVRVYDRNTSADTVVSYRIEGSADTVCAGTVTATTALDVVKNAADSCGYTYNIDELSFGPYLTRINDDEASGLTGWMYRVNWDSPSVGAGDYVLSEGDEVLWYFGDFSWKPLRLSSSDDTVPSGGSVDLTVESYENGVWMPVEDASVTGVGGNVLTTDSQGMLTVSPSDGIYNIGADKDEFIRSNKILVTVGDFSGQTVDVSVRVIESDDGGGGDVGGDNDTVSFTVTPDSIEFGDMRRGDTSNDTLTITNTGTADIYVEALVTGDDLFEKELELDNAHWSGFNAEIDTNDSKEISAEIRIPDNYSVNGLQTGTIIFWAIAR